MAKRSYDIRLDGFAPSASDPVEGLVNTFGVSSARARTILAKLPAVVKREATREEARGYLWALGRLGATVSIVDSETQREVAESELVKGARPTMAWSPKEMSITVQRDAPFPTLAAPAQEEPPSETYEIDSGESAEWGGPPLPPVRKELEDPFRIVREPDHLDLDAIIAEIEAEKLLLNAATGLEGRSPPATPAPHPAESWTDPFGDDWPDTFGEVDLDDWGADAEGDLLDIPDERASVADPGSLSGAGPQSESDSVPNFGRSEGESVGDLITQLYGEGRGSPSADHALAHEPDPDSPLLYASEPVEEPSAPEPEPAPEARGDQLGGPFQARTPSRGASTTPPPLELAKPPETPPPENVSARSSWRYVDSGPEIGIPPMAGGMRARAGPRDTLPPMPPPLARIREFESTGWSPLSRSSGLTPPSSPAVSDEHLDVAAADERPSFRDTRPRPVAAGPPPRPTAPLGRRRRSLAIGVCLVALAVAATALLLLTKGGVSDEMESALVGYQRTYLPDFELQEVLEGSIGSAERKELDEMIGQGRCYGWIATSLDGPQCDLDLELRHGRDELMSDVALDHYPVVFHCATDDAHLQLTLFNASGRDCDYGMARFERSVSRSWPLEAYVDLYVTWLNRGRRQPWLRLGSVMHGELSAGEQVQRHVSVPAQSCRTWLAISQQGTDIDAGLVLEGELVDKDEAPDNFPIVGACAEARGMEGYIEFDMYSGGGSFVWQALSGQPRE